MALFNVVRFAKSENLVISLELAHLNEYEGRRPGDKRQAG